MILKELKKGDFFTKKSIEYPNESQVWIKSDYNKTTKKYEIFRFSDVNDVQEMNGNKTIFIDFIF